MKTKHKIPLLKDHHTHPSLYAALRNCIDLGSVRDKQDALSLMRRSEDEISVIIGWNSSFYNFEDEELDSLPPVIIFDLSFHGLLMNKSARKKLSGSYGEIIANIDDGHWVERNLCAISKLIADLRKSGAQDIKSFFDDLLTCGIWYAEEMHLANKEILKNFQKIEYLDRTRLWADVEMLHSLNTEQKQLIHGIKIFVDGALGSKTAAIKGRFLAGEEGVLIYSDNELFSTLTRLTKFHKPIAIHAIGDLATDQILTILANMRKSESHVPQIRIEHCQFISKENAEKAKSLGIILSMQPNFNSDSVHYADRLSEEYCKNNNPFRVLIDEVGFVPGEDLIFGSDGMPHGVQYALEQALFPPFPHQTLSLDEFVAGYCMPDMKNGHIEVEVDEKERSVETNVISNS